MREKHTLAAGQCHHWLFNSCYQYSFISWGKSVDLEIKRHGYLPVLLIFTFSLPLKLAVIKSVPTSLPRTHEAIWVRQFGALWKQIGSVASKFPELPSRLSSKVQSVFILDWQLCFKIRAILFLLSVSFSATKFFYSLLIWGKFRGHFWKDGDTARSHFSTSLSQSKPTAFMQWESRSWINQPRFTRVVTFHIRTSQAEHFSMT